MSASGAAPRRACTFGVALAMLAGAVLVGGSGPARQQVGRPADGVLREWFGFNTRELEALGRRRAVVRSLDTVDSRDIATVAAVRMRISPAFYAARLRDIEWFAENDAVLQAGVFGSPARADDLRRLRLEPESLRELSRCRVQACGIQLSADAITQVARAAGDLPAAAEPTTEAMRGVLSDMVGAYQQSGAAALMRYADDARGQAVSREFERMVAQPPSILRRLPRLDQHLARYPRAESDGVEDVLYWSKVRLGPAVVLSITHLAIDRLADASAIEVAAVSKQLYASKHFDASLGMTLVLDRTRAGAAAVDIVYVNQSRLDVFAGFFGRLKRAMARPRVRAGMERALLAARDRLERAFGDGITRADEQHRPSTLEDVITVRLPFACSAVTWP